MRLPSLASDIYHHGGTGKIEHTPVRQLLVPNQVMTSQLLVIGVGQIGNDVAFGEGELVLRRFGRVPLFVSFN